MNAYYSPDASFVSKRAAVFVAIVALHVVVIYAFASGLARSGKRYIATILQTNIIQAEKPKDLPPPPPPVDLKERPPVQVIAPDINISVPVDIPPPITNVTTRPVARPPPTPAPHAIVVPGTPIQLIGGVDVNGYYPEQARRLGVEGRPEVKVCVSPNGKITSTEIVTGSGNDLLDAAALKVARAYKFKPATSEGKPVESCATLPVKFALHGG
jgi:protein TonB